MVKAAQLEAELAKQNTVDNPAPDQNRINQLITEQEQIKANRLAALQEACEAKCLVDKAEQGQQKALKELSSDPGYLLKTVERMISTNKRKATELSEKPPPKHEFSMLGEILNAPLVMGNDYEGVTYHHINKVIQMTLLLGILVKGLGAISKQHSEIKV